MSGDGLFHIDAEGQLMAMSVTPYEAEDLLQALLESHPDLLAGGQMNPDSPRRWLLVRREQGVPDREDAGYRWSVDHLFVDQDAVPTLVEVKRSTDTRIRREVVGQMLDYAANGVRYWPIPELQAAYVSTQQGLGREPEAEVQILCGDPTTSVDQFFVRVGDNLRAGRIRMVFVADVIPDELMRITEFLNEQMSPAEVFAVEVKQYRAEGYEGTVIVPAVYGRTAAASVKSGGARTSPNRDLLLSRSEPATLELIQLVQELGQKTGLVVREVPSGVTVKTSAGDPVANVWLADYNTIDISLQPLRDRGWKSQADEYLQTMRRMTTKTLTEKAPNVPSQDAVHHWRDLEQILIGVTQLYSNA